MCINIIEGCIKAGDLQGGIQALGKTYDAIGSQLQYKYDKIVFALSNERYPQPDTTDLTPEIEKNWSEAAKCFNELKKAVVALKEHENNVKEYTKRYNHSSNIKDREYNEKQINYDKNRTQYYFERVGYWGERLDKAEKTYKSLIENKKQVQTAQIQSEPENVQKNMGWIRLSVPGSNTNNAMTYIFIIDGKFAKQLDVKEQAETAFLELEMGAHTVEIQLFSSSNGKLIRKSRPQSFQVGREFSTDIYAENKSGFFSSSLNAKIGTYRGPIQKN